MTQKPIVKDGPCDFVGSDGINIRSTIFRMSQPVAVAKANDLTFFLSKTQFSIKKIIMYNKEGSASLKILVQRKITRCG